MKKDAASSRIVTWNVNSVRSRLQHLVSFLREYTPEIVLLQELKLEESQFPYEAIEECGYNCAVYGQKTYNGVAILSRSSLEDVRQGLYAEDEQARYIEAVTNIAGQMVRVASVYVPNGQEVGSDKFVYKLRFLEELHRYVSSLLAYNEVLVLGGDYNVAPTPQDVWDAKALEGTVCYHPEERRRLHALLHSGVYDAYRSLHPQGEAASWWDYRGGAFDRGQGLRIDHLLLSAEAVDCLVECEIVMSERAKEKPSDHAPVMASFAFT